jgi:hypothetical protein
VHKYLNAKIMCIFKKFDSLNFSTYFIQFSQWFVTSQIISYPTLTLKRTSLGQDIFAKNASLNQFFLQVSTIMSSNCGDLPRPYGTSSEPYKHQAIDEVYYAGESPRHVNKSMLEASQVPLPFDEDDDMVPVDEVSILYNFTLL